MSLELYLAFVLATAILILIPGPTVTLVVANSITYGARYALMTIAGTSLAMAIQLVFVWLGMTSLMHLLAEWFDWLRWAGVAYLFYLGWQQWRAAPIDLDDVRARKVPLKRLFLQGFVVSATNPKSLLFYAAFFPQFIAPGFEPEPQVLLLCISFWVIATILDSSYCLLAGRLRHFLQGHKRALLRNRITGTLIMGAGIGLAMARKS